MKGYKDLDIYNLAFKLAVRIYRLSLKLPHPDKFETGSQIRRSSQSVKDNIVEGYGRKRYKADFIKFLVASHASCLEATSQAEFLAEVQTDQEWTDIANELDKAGIKIYNFIIYVEKNWKTGRG
ncbi:four helix bundle protein [Mariniphaga sp.]|uniref:four helix bundle protein n=1 Tax=Mariniphaga sp. TaxID=1954475 RepID=UPI003562793A